MMLFMDSDRDDVALAEKKKRESQRVILIIEPPGILKSKNHNSPCVLCFCRSLGTK